MMSHTPGPWRRYRDKTGRVSKIEGRGRRVCTFQPSDLNAEANASLIAAAPEMLEALLELRECADYWSEYDVPLGIVKRLDETIMKARGLA